MTIHSALSTSLKEPVDREEEKRKGGRSRSRKDVGYLPTLFVIRSLRTNEKIPIRAWR